MLKDIQIGWVDLVLVVLLIVGMVRGRKRGVSQELLDVLKWAVAVVAGAFLYQPLGSIIADATPLSHLVCYVGVYLLILLMTVFTFSAIKKPVGEKLMASDAFGDGEYYLGIFAGFTRYLCVILIVLSLINARHFQPQEAQARVQSQMNNFGIVFFTMPEFQKDVFQQSMLGRFSQDYLSLLMIEPTPADDKVLGAHRRAVQARERSMNEILD